MNSINQHSDSRFRRLMRSDEVSVLIPLLAIMLLTTLVRPDFLTVSNFSAMFTQIPFIAITALAVSFPLMTGNVDISTGRVAGFAGILMAALVVDAGWSAFPAIIVSLICCAAIGLFNGLLVVHFGVPDFVATMGSLYMVGGARYLFIKGYQLSLNTLPDFPLVHVFDGRYLGMPLYFWIMILLYGIAFVVTKKTVWGRQIIAVGDNREVAMLAGIPVKKIRMTAYSLSAILSGIAGILITLDVGIGLPETGDGWEFRAIAGCAVGGVSLAGGKASPLGILIGITLIFVAENAIIFIGLPSTMRIAVQGALMAGAVLFDLYKQKRKIPA
ncbi:MAG: ABC transporter permease [Christensenellales bacterium]|jgi:ribose/xylose/arabinose/galactoside ABC-type transport system permease subunit